MLSIRDIQEIVCAEYGLTRDQMLGVRRTRAVSHPRMIAMWISYEILAHKSLTQIGKAFNRDHSTVMHAARQWKSILGYSLDHIQSVHRIIKTIRRKAGIDDAPLS
jgi:chromosomal replication initiator protein